MLERVQPQAELGDLLSSRLESTAGLLVAVESPGRAAERQVPGSLEELLELGLPSAGLAPRGSLVPKLALLAT